VIPEHHRRPPADCPACRSELLVTRLSCTACGTEVTGAFTTCAFCSQDAGDRALLELFLLSRGNLKEVERKLGVSYPTARARVDAMIDRLGLRSDERRRLETLQALARGEIDVDAAMTAIG
jgi:hypothetical protein